MLIPIAIFLVCLLAGAGATANWLPDLAPGPIGGIAFLLVSGLVGLALGTAAMHIYTLVENANAFGGDDHGVIAAGNLASLAWETGALLALALALYLISPKPTGPSTPIKSPHEPRQ